MNLADRMKLYEKQEAGRKTLPKLPVCVRLDGRSFSRWTKGLARPFDSRLTSLMLEVAKELVQQSGAMLAYTQSDEITLVFYSENLTSQIFFDGKIQKLASVLASIATATFNHLVPSFLPEKEGNLAHFDCRVWTVPTLIEAANVILWREQDAVRNSVQMAAQALYGHKQLQNKNTSDLHEMLFQKDINWNDYPASFKRGTYVFRKVVERTLTPQEISQIPEKNRPDSSTKVVRSEYVATNLPPLREVTNPIDVLFLGAEPTFETSEDS